MHSCRQVVPDYNCVPTCDIPIAKNLAVDYSVSTCEANVIYDFIEWFNAHARSFVFCAILYTGETLHVYEDFYARKNAFDELARSNSTQPPLAPSSWVMMFSWQGKSRTWKCYSFFDSFQWINLFYWIWAANYWENVYYGVPVRKFHSFYCGMLLYL